MKKKRKWKNRKKNPKKNPKEIQKKKVMKKWKRKRKAKRNQVPSANCLNFFRQQRIGNTNAKKRKKSWIKQFHVHKTTLIIWMSCSRKIIKDVWNIDNKWQNHVCKKKNKNLIDGNFHCL